MKKIFIVYGILICSAFGYATYRGWNVADSLKSGTWGPNGPTNHAHGGVYHK